MNRKSLTTRKRAALSILHHLKSHTWFQHFQNLLLLHKINAQLN